MKVIIENIAAPAQAGNDGFQFKEILDLIGYGQTLWSLLGLFISVFLIIGSLALFRMQVNKISKKQINSFIKVRKYTPELYTELNENMECLRYFMFSYRWKWRIIKNYNLLFKGYVGKQLKQAYNDEICYRIPYFASIKTVKKTIAITNSTLNNFRNDRERRIKVLGDFYFVAKNLSYDCIYATKNLLSYCAKIESKNMIVVGSAGNGKTNLMCRAAETAIANKIPCLLLNSKEVDGKAIDFILDKLPFTSKIKNHPAWFLRTINTLLWATRKNLLILIDAINENDSDDFLNSIGTVCDYFEKYSRVRVVLTCRSEYFDVRYKKLFGESEKPLSIFQLCTTDYDERAIDNFFLKYSNHFNVPQRFSANVYNKIRKSLFLMRIFFEVNSGRPYENLEFQNAEIYKLYIEKVALEHPEIDVHSIIRQLSSIMIDSDCYDNVDLKELNLSTTEKQALLNMLDNNLIINKTIQLGTGISERSTESLYFIFDEFRDFCIARELIIRDEDNQDPNYSLFVRKVAHMSETAMAPLEGILKYGYYHFNKNGPTELSQRILKVYGKSSIQQANYTQRMNREKPYYFDDFGLSLIYMDGSALKDYEYEYVCDAIRSSDRSNIQTFFFLLNNEITNESPNLCQYLDMITNSTDAIVLESLVDRLGEQNSLSGNGLKLIDIIYRKIDAEYPDMANIPENIKKMLLLIFSRNVDVWYRNRSGEYIDFEDSLFDELASELNCEKTKNAIKELRAQKTTKPFLKLNNVIDFILTIYGKQ